MSGTIEEKLIILGFGAEEIPETVEIFTAAADFSSLRMVLGEKGVTLGAEQYLYRSFKILYALYGEIRERVHRDLGNLSVPPESITEYFTKYQQQPSLVFGRRHPEIPAETMKRFYPAANELMLKILRDYAGIQLT